MSVTKIKDKLVKRNSKWYEILMDFTDIPSDPEKYATWCRFRSKHPNMSLNRSAYNVLKTYYSTTALNRLLIDYEMYKA